MSFDRAVASRLTCCSTRHSAPSRSSSKPIPLWRARSSRAKLPPPFHAKNASRNFYWHDRVGLPSLPRRGAYRPFFACYRFIFLFSLTKIFSLALQRKTRYSKPARFLDGKQLSYDLGLVTDISLRMRVNLTRFSWLRRNEVFDTRLIPAELYYKCFSWWRGMLW